MKVKTILISQKKPEIEKSPYFDLAERYKLKIDFVPFIHIEGISAHDFRKEKINILDHSAVIFTSRNAVDHFFRICTDMRITPPESVKYFCISEAISYYLQKYVLYRKRRVLHGNQTFSDLVKVIRKCKGENFLLPCSDILKEEIPILLNKHKIKYTKATLYRTICSDLAEIKDIHYDMLVFFSPSGIKSLFQNFPNFTQNTTRIATFGLTTTKAAKAACLKVDIAAPQPNAPSMTMAIEQYIKKIEKKQKKVKITSR